MNPLHTILRGGTGIGSAWLVASLPTLERVHAVAVVVGVILAACVSLAMFISVGLDATRKAVDLWGRFTAWRDRRATAAAAANANAEPEDHDVSE